MTSTGVVTDSTADLSPEAQARLGVVMVPLIVNWDGQTYRDKLDLTPTEFYRRLRTSKTLPKTGSPSVVAFETAFREQLQQHDSAICLNLAAPLSGTFEVARRAAESVDPQRVFVVDSGSVSVCIGWLAELAVTLAKQGLPPAEIVEQLEETRGRLRVLALLETLTFLQRGGRIGRAAALAGTLLNVKPILSVHNGEVAPVERVRTMNSALRRLVELVGAEGPLERVGVVHADSPANAAEVEDQLRRRYPDLSVDRGELGPVVGTHGGPGVIGVGFLLAELLEAASRIFRAEAADGYRDRVVIGGLSGFAAKLQDVAAGSELAHLLGDYASLPPAERAERLEAARSLLYPDAAPSDVVATTSVAPTQQSHPVAQRTRASAPPPAGVTLATRIESLKGVGPVRARLYSRLAIFTVRDLLFHFPVRHQAFPPVSPINELFFKAEGSVVGILERVEVENLPRSLKKLRATVRDASGRVQAVWLRHGVARLGINTGEHIALSGRLIVQGRQLVFESPDYERADGASIHTRRLVPVHPLTAGLTERELRGRIFWALTYFAQTVTDPLPEAIRRAHNLLAIDRALWQMHFPDSLDDYAVARRRFAFEELLTIQLMVLQRRMTWQHDPAPALPRHDGALSALEGGLPFSLTGAQRRVTDEILADVALRKPMTRLLQGEVGSGKTAVAALSLMNAVANGFQGALMAPTEILAEQHFATVARLFEAAGPALEGVLGRQPSVTLLTGSVKGKVRTQAYDATAAGDVDLVVGTQALIQDKLEFARLGLVIVDEQHRFGVRQRVSLRRRAGEGVGVPHLLVMTATPIPRTLALSLYGDLDLSAIDEMPPGRQFPRTKLLGSDERDFAYERVRRAAEQGQQSFIICPLVEESEVLQAKSATEEYERLRAGELASLRLGLLHGRMRPAEKDAIMRAFRDREFDVLVSTAVVEVGVDVPNATVMLIEGAERFGLAQLHQFRGRVGRGGQPSVCILLSDLPDPGANERLQAVAETTNGLVLAEHDLRLRGPGDYFGVRQSGMPELKVAKLDDAPLVESARAAATAILSDDPELARAEHHALSEHIAAFVASSGDPS